MISNEQATAATARTSVGLNVNGNDAKIRDSRFQRMGTTMVLKGNGHLIVGNHWFQGDEVTDGPRVAGLVFTETNVKSVVTGNYVDNCFIEWTNEHDATPALGTEFSFGGLTVTGNIFTANDVAPWFSWIVVKPFGAGHFLQGFSVTGNAFKALSGNVDRVERVDALDRWARLQPDAERRVFGEHVQRGDAEHDQPRDARVQPGDGGGDVDLRRGRLPAVRRLGARGLLASWRRTR